MRRDPGKGERPQEEPPLFCREERWHDVVLVSFLAVMQALAVVDLGATLVAPSI